MNYYSEVIFLDRTKLDLTDTDVANAQKVQCFDMYFQRDTENLGTFWFKPKFLKSKPVEEFIDELKSRTRITVRESLGFLSLEYPYGYDKEDIYIFDYLIHQLARIPAIFTLSTSRSIVGKSFQKCLEELINIDTFYSFKVLFNYTDVLDRIHSKRLSKSRIKNILTTGGKQTAIAVELLRPCAVEHVPSGKFLQTDIFDKDAIEILQFYGREDFLEEVLGDAPKNINEFQLDKKFKLHALPL